MKQYIVNKTFNREISYKSIPLGYYNWANETSKEKLEVCGKGFIQDAFLRKVDFEKKETVVVNVGVGQGKSTSAREIIHRYALDGGYKIIVASPFKKLVQRDTDKLRNLDNDKYNVSNYFELDSPKTNIKQLAKNEVHVLTINTLLQNPGDDNYFMTSRKKEYIECLINECKFKGLKVIIVLDEIHESIHNFNQYNVFNLFKWKDVVHKAFVLSATYSEASFLVVEYIAYLTNNIIKILESKREKFPIQARLNLVFIKNNLQSFIVNKEITKKVDYIINLKNNEGKTPQVLCAYKSTAQIIFDEFKEKYKDRIQCLTGDKSNKYEFDEDIVNIGTTFKTGIDIKDENSYLVIIAPIGISSNFTGIFYDGIPSIVQAIARMRVKGDIYLLLEYPKNLISDGKYDSLIPDKIKRKFKYSKFKQIDEDQIHDIMDYYYFKKDSILKEIEFVQNQAKMINVDTYKNIEYEKAKDYKMNFRAPLDFPTIENFILSESQGFLSKTFQMYGKGFTPFVLWAGYYNQFVNCKLHTLHFDETVPTSKIIIDSNFDLAKSLLESIKQYAFIYYEINGSKTNKLSLPGKVDGMSDIEAYQDLINRSKWTLNVKYDSSKDDYMPIETLNIYLNHKGNELSTYSSRFVKAILGLLYSIRTENNENCISWKVEQYILNNVAVSLKNPDKNSELINAYSELYQIVCDLFKKLPMSIHPNRFTFDVQFKKRLANVSNIIQKHDNFVGKGKAFTFLNNFNTRNRSCDSRGILSLIKTFTIWENVKSSEEGSRINTRRIINFKELPHLTLNFLSE